MKTAMENIKEMVDVNTIIGDPVETPDGQVIIPVSKVGFGFAAGGSEFKNQKHEERTRDCPDQDRKQEKDKNGTQFPFGGGSGGGVSITPVGFIVVGEKGIRLLNLEGSTHLYDRLIDLAPGLLERLQNMGRKKKGNQQQNNDCPPPQYPGY
nr:GerW family sporulation protein [Paenactinomyces guangxiensis]